MTEAVIIPAAISPAADEKGETGLVGHLNTFDIVLATLAYAAPLAGAAGYSGVAIGFGNGIGTPVTFLIITGVLLLFSVGYGAATRYIPNPGAFYAYITAGLGRPAGLGSAFLILGSYFTIGIGFYAFAGIASKQLVEGFGGPIYPWWMYAGIFWIAVGTLAYFHVAVSARVLGFLLVLEIIAITYFDWTVIGAGGRSGLSLESFTPHAFFSGNIGLGFIFTIAMFSGFEATAIYREETRNPDTTIPRATFIVVLFIGLTYALTSWCIIDGLGVPRVVGVAAANPPEAYFAVARQFGGMLFYQISSVLLLTSTFACHLAIQNVTTRYVYSLARDGVFPRLFGVAHNRHHSPHRASMACSAIYFLSTAGLYAGGLTVVQIYTWFAGIASFAIICALACTSLAAFAYFTRFDHRASRWQAQIAPAAAFFCLLAIIVLGVINFPVLISGSRALANEMLAGLLVLFVIGFGVAMWLRDHKPEVYRNIGRQGG